MSDCDRFLSDLAASTKDGDVIRACDNHGVDCPKLNEMTIKNSVPKHSLGFGCVAADEKIKRLLQERDEARLEAKAYKGVACLLRQSLDVRLESGDIRVPLWIYCEGTVEEQKQELIAEWKKEEGNLPRSNKGNSPQKPGDVAEASREDRGNGGSTPSRGYSEDKLRRDLEDYGPETAGDE